MSPPLLFDRRDTLKASLAVAGSLATLPWASARVADAMPVAGKVKLVHGRVTLTTADGTERPAAVGMSLHSGDLISTAKEAELHAEMEDGAYLAARPNAQIKLVAYQMTGTAGDTSWIDVFKGGLRMVSGWIAKSNPGAYRLRTPVATIGIRGTDFEVQHFSDGEGPSPEEDGTHHLVYEGTTVLSTEVGDVEVPSGMAAFATDRQGAPALYAEVPRFLNLKRKRGKFDAQVDAKAASIKETIMAKLQEKNLATPAETLADRIERFKLENPESALSNRKLMERAARRAAGRGANNQGGGKGGSGQR